MTADQEEPSKARFSRRRLMAGGLAGSAIGMAAAALGKGIVSGSEARSLRGQGDFDKAAAEIYNRHWQQDEITVRSLKARYEVPVFGKVRMWDLVEKLALCVDPTDRTLYCANQYIHLQQILEGMERDRVDDNDLVLAALVHDLGKVALLTDEVPENVVCVIRPLDEYGEGVGLDNILCQFGHDEIAYMRIKDQVPDFVAWLTRHHSMDPEDMLPHLDERDRGYYEKYLTFRSYDIGTKSAMSLPRVNMEKYRDIIEEAFPSPILF